MKELKELEIILKAVAWATGVPLDLIKGKSQKSYVRRARKIYYYYATKQGFKDGFIGFVINRSRGCVSTIKTDITRLLHRDEDEKYYYQRTSDVITKRLKSIGLQTEVK